MSTIDMVGRHLLLAGVDGSDWVSAASAAAAAFGELHLDAFCIGKDPEDPDQRFPQAFGISTAGASLVRPDGFVAWRSPTAVSDPVAALRDALGRSLGF